ncbi:MAG: thiamine diphosphokinase [Chloroflexi bacterium]|nr:thiamine diphosphokinase [Chloroflexota bacterium]
MGRPAVVFASAPVRDSAWLRRRLRALDRRPFVVAADGGADTARVFDLAPDLVVGDLDSISAGSLARLEAEGVCFEPLPRDKDVTDGEVAVLRAGEAIGAGGEVLVVGALGGPRLDHGLANLGLLARFGSHVVLLDEANEVRLLRGPETRRWAPEPGEIVSLIAWGVAARGVATSGLRWALDGFDLPVGSTRAISNEPSRPDGEVAVTLAEGLLLVTRYVPDFGSEARPGL